MRTIIIAALAVTACGRTSQFDAPPGPVSTTCTGCATAYSATQGLTVHEWGTFTSVVGSDGTVLPGLHHEEEDLPGFVADRVAQAKWSSDIYASPTEKMETPVTYFYASKPMQVSAKVRFPNGILTQWFPYVKAMQPYIYRSSEDPWLSTSVTPLTSCPIDYAHPFHDGLLDWGTFDVLGPDQSADLATPLGKTTWSFSRNVASNVVHMPSPDGVSDQYEKFLFYRGLGQFDLPLQPTLGTSATFTNRDGRAEVGGLLLMRVTADSAGFSVLGDVAAGSSLTAALPQANMSHDDFVPMLKATLKARLTQTGLYDDEAQAMVDTWERSYFLTPGLRLLYVLPQAHTDAIIPLEISPQPVELRRTLVIRVELLTPDDEATLVTHLKEQDDKFFWAQGRFAEPYLSRALQLEGGDDAHGQDLLTQIRVQRRWAPLAAE